MRSQPWLNFQEYDFCLQKMEKLYAASPDDRRSWSSTVILWKVSESGDSGSPDGERTEGTLYPSFKTKAEGENDALHMCASVPKSDENRRLCSGGRDSRADGSECLRNGIGLKSIGSGKHFEDAVVIRISVSGRTKKRSGSCMVFKTDEKEQIYLSSKVKEVLAFWLD